MWTALSGMIGNVWTEVGNYITTATSEPVLLIPVAFGFAGATVGLFRRMTRLGGKRR